MLYFVLLFHLIPHICIDKCGMGQTFVFTFYFTKRSEFTTDNFGTFKAYHSRNIDEAFSECARFCEKDINAQKFRENEGCGKTLERKLQKVPDSWRPQLAVWLASTTILRELLAFIVKCFQKTILLVGWSHVRAGKFKIPLWLKILSMRRVACNI